MNAAMKSLNEQIEEVMSSAKSQRAKRDELVKIGLCQRDIDMLFFADRIAKKHGKNLSQLMTGYTFGVEIECYNAPRQMLLAAANRQGLAMRSESYNHDDNRHYYKLVQDGSIRGIDPVECVSPILQGDNSGFDSLKACCDALNEIGAMVNKSTGLHIHVGGNITEQQYCNTLSTTTILKVLLTPSWLQAARMPIMQARCTTTPTDAISTLTLCLVRTLLSRWATLFAMTAISKSTANRGCAIIR